jgi:hypothetical protein
MHEESHSMQGDPTINILCEDHYMQGDIPLHIILYYYNSSRSLIGKDTINSSIARFA